MTSDPEEEAEMAIVDVVTGGPETQAAVRVVRIKARDLNDTHVGQWIGAHENGYNYGLKILKVKHVNEGTAPGVTVWYRKSQLPDGTPPADSNMHVPFDTDFELVDMMAW
ncbi:hypothetical protein NLX62_02425 [Mycobacteriaceae bacterium Msp059]|nr:hypothetical protein [Mycobacteriaceae bacterium Msp059]